jgi:hypothetical protein
MDIRVRQWEKLKYLDSEAILRGLRKIQESNPLHELPYDVASLRRRDLRTYAEGRQAALFCYGMSQIDGTRVSFAQAEASDYDVVARYVRDDVAHFVPVQLKELVPDRVNPRADLQLELDKIAKYVDSAELVVAFHLNTTKRIEFSELRMPIGRVGELWFFGATTEDQVNWVLLGNMLRDERYAFSFRHPGA